MWFIVVIVCLLLAFGIYTAKQWKAELVANEQKKQEEARKKKEREEWQKKRKTIYKNHLPNIYNGLSRQKLNQVYPLLETMHYNNYHHGDPNWSKATDHIYVEAKNELIKLLNYPKWNIGNGWSTTPLWVEFDMNYVYELLNR